jgi:hypothetical protein
MSTKKKEEAKTALLEINELLVQLDPSIRASAFDILRALYFMEDEPAPKRSSSAKDSDDHSQDNSAPSELADFIASRDHKKPADNVLLLAAWLYSMYGQYPITAKEIKELGNSCGLILPARPDNTMRQAKNKGKSLFNQQGKGWQPTVSGEIYFKDEYKVKKGSKPLPKE